MKKSTPKTKNTPSKLGPKTALAVKKFNTQFDKHLTFKGEVNNSPSLTVPDMSLTIKQLLTNHTRGIHSDVSINEPQYFDYEIPQIDDITDLHAFRRDLQLRKQALELKIKEENDRKLALREEQIKAQEEQNKLDKQ